MLPPTGVRSGECSRLGEGEALTALPLGYTEVGWVDLDGDGKTDRIVQNGTGGTYVFLMDGLNELPTSGSLPQVPDGWFILGFPDLDGLNGADMVVQRISDGATYAYILDGKTVVEDGQIPGLPANDSYTTIGFPNLDGVNGADIVIQEAGGFPLDT